MIIFKEYGKIFSISEFKPLVIFICLVYIFSSNQIFAQKEDYVISYFNTNDGLSSNTVNDIVQDEFNNIWIATEMGLFKYNGYDFKKQKFSNNDSDLEFLFVSQDINNTIWTISKSGKIYYKNEKELTFQAYIWNDNLFTRYNLINPKITNFVVKEYFIYFTLNENIPVRVYHDFGIVINVDKDFNESGNSICEEIQRIYLIDIGDISIIVKIYYVLNKDNSCYLVYDEKKNIANTKVNRDKELYGLKVNKIIQDDSGGFWIASELNGLCYIPSIASKYIYKNTFKESITNLFNIDSTSSVVSTNKALYSLNDRGIVEIFRVKNQINSVVYDEFEKKLWFKNNNEIFNIDLNTNRVEQQDLNIQELDGNLEGAIFTESSILKIVKGKLTKFSKHIDQEPQVMHLTINSSLTIPSPNIIFYNRYSKYIGVLFDDAIFFLDEAGNLVSSEQMPIKTSGISSIMVKDSISTYMGSYSRGILTFEKQKYISNITKADGLNNDEVLSVHFFRNLSYLTSLGYGTIISPNSYAEIVEYKATNDIMPRPGYKIVSQKFQTYIWNKIGLLEIPSNSRVIKSKKPVVQTIRINGQNKKDYSKLNYFENNIEISYLTTNPKLKGKITYQYRLNLGEWITIRDTTFSLINLNPDKYVLEIRSQNEEKFWSTSTSVNFTIQPPWWSTWSFIFSTILILSVILYQLYKSRIKRIHKSNEIAEEIRNLEKSALQAQMNPHFIFNCLNSIQGFIMENNKEQAMEYLGGFAQLIRSNLNASISDKISLDEEYRILYNYLKLERLRLNNAFEFEISLPGNKDAHDIMIPPMLIQPFVENAVIHGMKNGIKDGRIAINFELIDSTLYTEISDNANVESTETKKNGHKSVGTEITRKRLNYINQSNQSIEDLNINHTPSGTIVTLSILLD